MVACRAFNECYIAKPRRRRILWNILTLWWNVKIGRVDYIVQSCDKNFMYDQSIVRFFSFDVASCGYSPASWSPSFWKIMLCLRVPVGGAVICSGNKKVGKKPWERLLQEDKGALIFWSTHSRLWGPSAKCTLAVQVRKPPYVIKS